MSLHVHSGQNWSTPDQNRSYEVLNRAYNYYGLFFVCFLLDQNQVPWSKLNGAFDSFYVSAGLFCPIKVKQKRVERTEERDICNHLSVTDTSCLILWKLFVRFMKQQDLFWSISTLDLRPAGETRQLVN